MSGAIAKTVKYSLIIVGVLIVALLAAPFFIDVNTYKGQIEKVVEDATGRQLSIGNIKASLFPWVGVELDNVHLANRAGYTKRDFLSVKRLHVKLALMPLLSRNIEIKDFEVVSPVVYLERRSNGESNWGDLVAAPKDASAGDSAQSAQSAQSAPAAPALAALLAESLTLTGGKVTWVDADAEPVVLSDLDVALTDVQLKRPVAVKISGKLSGNAFELDANVGPLGDLAKLDLLSLPVQGQLKADNISLKPFKNMIRGWPAQLGDISQAWVGVSAKIEQHPDGIRVSEGDLLLNATHKLGMAWKIELTKADQLKVSRAALTVDGKSIFEANGSVKNLTSNPTFKLRFESQPITRTWLTTFVPDLNQMYADHPAPWKQVKINASLSGSSKKMDIGDLQLRLDDDVLKATGAVVFNGPDIRLRISAKSLHMDPWLPQGTPEQQTARLSSEFSFIGEALAAADASAEPDFRFLKSWIVTTKLQVGTLFMRGLEMGNFSATINGSKGRFNLSPLSFNLAGGKVTEKASLNVASYPAKWTESVHITGVQAGPLLKALADMDMLTGTMAMDTSLRATGLTQTAVSSLNGRGNVLFNDGKIKGFDIAGALRKFTNPAAYKQGPKETDFAQLSGSFKIKNGIVDNQDLYMASPLLRVTGKGTVNLVSKTMDYYVKPRVIGSLKGQGGSMLRKGLTIPLKISGPFAAPKVRPDISAKTLIDNAPALLNRGKIGSGLRKLLGGGKLGGARSQPAAQPESPQKKILKDLGRMIPGF